MKLTECAYPRIVRAVEESVWALAPQTVAVISELLALRSAGERLDPAEIEARLEAAGRMKAAQGVRRIRSGSTAIVPIHGMITYRASMFSDVSGMTSVEQVREDLSEALDDPKVSSIVLHIDSPGGNTDGIAELADDVYQARGGDKPIVAVADAMAASAAYWIATQAAEFVASPSANVGSIGVIMMHVDRSERLAKDGIKQTAIHAGRYKTAGAPFEPLTDETRAVLQARVDDMYGLFVEAVARGRGVDEETVRAGFGEGQVLLARRAMAEGMIDGVETLRSVLSRLAVAAPPSAPRAAQPAPPRRRASGTGRARAALLRAQL
jgi:signal peptide peptidase SppA